MRKRNSVFNGRINGRLSLIQILLMRHVLGSQILTRQVGPLKRLIRVKISFVASVDQLTIHLAEPDWLPQIIINKIARLAAHSPHLREQIGPRNIISHLIIHMAISHRVVIIKLRRISKITVKLGHVAINNRTGIHPLIDFGTRLGLNRGGQHVSRLQRRISLPFVGI